MTAAEENLYEFYQAIAATGKVNVVSDAGFLLLSDKKMGWPQIIYNFNTLPGLIKTFKESSAFNGKCLDKFQIVANRELFDSAVGPLLRDSGIFPITLWELMEIPESVSSPYLNDNQSEILNITGREEIIDFANHVNSSMMNDARVDANLFLKLACDGSCTFYCLRIKAIIVVSALVFSSAQYAGLYFIATKPEFRGRGYAEQLIRYLVNYLFSEGKEKVVLQSVRKAVSLYTQIGFRSSGKLAVLRKI